MNNKLLIILLGVIQLTLVSCKRDSEVTLQVNPTFGTQPLEFNTDYVNSEGLRVQFTDIKFFISDFYLENDKEPFAQDVKYFDLRGGRTSATYDIARRTYEGARFLVGVNPIDNANTPANYAADHELGNNVGGEVYWDWMGSYVFITIEGRYDSLPAGSGTPTYPFSFHIGGDEHLRAKDYANMMADLKKKKTHDMTLDLDMEKFFHAVDTIHLATENVSHSNPGQEIITQKVRDNFVASLTLR